MPRIRYIKPDYWFDFELAQLTLEARLGFIGLWNIADRDGRLHDRPPEIRAKIFPYEPRIQMDKILDELASHWIHRYEVKNHRYIQIINFHKHQKIHHTEKESDIPEPELVTDVNGEVTVKGALNNREVTVKQPLSNGGIAEGMGKGRVKGNGKGMDNTMSSETPKFSPESFVKLYNDDTPPNWGGVKTDLPLSDARKRKIRMALQQRPHEPFWKIVYKNCHRSDFLSGRVSQKAPHENWKPSMDWLLSKNRNGTENYILIYDGHYVADKVGV